MIRCLSTGDVSLGHVDKVVTASFLHCDVPLFPFAIHKYLSGGAGVELSRLCQYLISSYISAR